MSSSNAQLTERFSELFPGAHSNNTPAAAIRTFQARAQGSRFWDIEGKEFVDYTGASGPNILGHRHPAMIEALQTSMATDSFCTGSSYLFSEADIQLGEKIVQHLPCAEQIKFCASGSEAVQQAVRLARAYTGRPYYLKFGGHYHGWIDNIIGGEPDPAPTGAPFPLYDKQPIAGQSEPSQREGLLIPWADLECLQHTLKHHGEQIAIMLIETVSNSGSFLPPAGYLEQARALCDHYGIVLCFDEVITGFRVGLNGAQGLFGVTPDLCTLGKAFGGGMPLAAVAGQRFLLEQYRDQQVMGPGTYNGHPLGIRGALAAIKVLETNNGEIYQQMASVQQRLMSGLDNRARGLNIPVRVQGPTGVFGTFFDADPDQPIITLAGLGPETAAITKRVHQALWAEGISSLFGRWFMSVVHNDSDTERTLAAFERVLKTL